ADALKLAAGVRGDFARTPALQVRLQLAEAAVHQYHYKDAAAASKIYKAILDEHKRVEHPNLRLAAIRWGDLFAETGDLVRASEMIFKLPQWAGYRDRATYGISDTYFRMGELEKARKWLADLKEGFPKQYEAQKGADVEKLIDGRLRRLKAARAKGDPAAAF